MVWTGKTQAEARGEFVERFIDVVAADVERVERALVLRILEAVLRDLPEQVARICAFNGGRASLGAAEGEVMSTLEARRQRTEAEHIGKVLDPGQPVAEVPMVIGRDRVRPSVDIIVVTCVGQAVAERKQRRIHRAFPISPNRPFRLRGFLRRVEGIVSKRLRGVYWSGPCRNAKDWAPGK